MSISVRHVAVLVGLLLILERTTTGEESKKSNKIELEEQFDVYRQSRLPTALTPQLLLETSGVNETTQSAALFATVGDANDRSPVCRLTFPELKLNSVIPLEGKLYRISQLSSGKDGNRPKITFTRFRDEELQKKISSDDDSYFLPIGGSVRRRSVDMEIATVPAEDADNRLRVAFTLRPEKASQNPNAVYITAEQRRQVLGVGDVIRMGPFGLKIRNIVPASSDGEFTIPGWVEVYKKETDLTKG